MPAIEIKPGIYWIGVNDRTTDLFEGMWPISQEGVSYNSYLVLDEKKALIDMARSGHGGALLQQVEDLVNPAELDYVVLNHLEPDHTGAVSLLYHLAPHAEFLMSAKAVPMLAAYYGITERVRAVADGEELPLGAKKLRFVATPFVHWPETMVTYEEQTRVLFSCDAFGGYGALHGAIFDDDCIDMSFYEREALRYYVNIVARFSGPVLKAIDKLQGVPIDVVAPSHGLIWRSDPMRIVSLYAQWAKLATEPAEPGVTLLFGSMYGNTEALMNAVAEGVSKVSIPLAIYDVARTHSAYILPSLWTKSGVLVGAPTYEVSLFPPMAEALHMAAHKRIMHRKVGYFGSYGWSKGAFREAQELTSKLEWEWGAPLEVNGGPNREVLRAAEQFGEAFARSLLA
ncbi:MAG: FprA family A-type flavoprotein [Anaerolineales bacterium]